MTMMIYVLLAIGSGFLGETLEERVMEGSNGFVSTLAIAAYVMMIVTLVMALVEGWALLESLV